MQCLSSHPERFECNKEDKNDGLSSTLSRIWFYFYKQSSFISISNICAVVWVLPGTTRSFIIQWLELNIRLKVSALLVLRSTSSLPSLRFFQRQHLKDKQHKQHQMSVKTIVSPVSPHSAEFYTNNKLPRGSFVLFLTVRFVLSFIHDMTPVEEADLRSVGTGNRPEWPWFLLSIVSCRCLLLFYAVNSLRDTFVSYFLFLPAASLHIKGFPVRN